MRQSIISGLKTLLQFVIAVVVITTLCILVLQRCAYAAEPSISELATKFVGEEEAAVVEAVCFEVGEEYDIDPWLIAWVWRYEAGFQKYPDGYYLGGLQLDPEIHLKHFKEYGLDPTSWKDWIRYGVQLWRLSADKDYSLFQALEPWGVRGKAMKAYKKTRGSYDRWDSFTDETTVE